MIDPNPLHSSLEVDQVFARFLARDRGLDDGGIDALCRKHPAFAKGLRALYADWKKVDRFLNDIRQNTPSTSVRIRRLYGSYVDPAITLPGDREGDTSFSKQVLGVESEIESRGPWLLGDTFTGADILLETCLRWAGHVGIEIGPTLDDYLCRAQSRPAYQAASSLNYSINPDGSPRS